MLLYAVLEHMTVRPGERCEKCFFYPGVRARVPIRRAGVRESETGQRCELRCRVLVITNYVRKRSICVMEDEDLLRA